MSVLTALAAPAAALRAAARVLAPTPALTLLLALPARAAAPSQPVPSTSPTPPVPSTSLPARSTPPVPSTSPTPPVPSTSPTPPVPSTSLAAPVPSTILAAPVPSTSPTPPAASDPLDPAAPLTIDRAVALALAANPGLHAAAERVRGQLLLAEAEAKPAGPALSLDIWQVPLARPWAIYDSPMIMLAVRQPIPAAGLLRRRAAARRHDATATSHEREAQAQTLALAVRHAFIEYAAVSDRHALHREHQAVSERVLQLARARQVVSGSLLEIARAETEAARAHAEVATDATTIDAARVRLNSLMARPPDAPLGPPVALPDERPAADATTLITRARDLRPEPRAAAARRDAAAMDLQAARRAANLPEAELGLAFFPATRAQPINGYGLLVNIALPWLSGQGRKRRDAQAAFTSAAGHDLAEAQLQVGREVAEALATAESAARRWQTLRGAALPASQRAREGALSGYEVGRADLLAMLATEAAYVEVSLEIIDAKAALDHALADLERASGSPLPRAPLRPEAPQHASNLAREPPVP